MIFKYQLCDCLIKLLIKLLKACPKLLKVNPRTDDQIFDLNKQNLKDLKIQCCYKKEISYETVSSSKFDTDDVQIDIFSNFWLNITEFQGFF